MNGQPNRVEQFLSERFILDFPHEAARSIERLTPEQAAPVLAEYPVPIVAPMATNLLPEFLANVLPALEDAHADRLLAELPAAYAVRVLGHLDDDQVAARINRLDDAISTELKTLLSYPIDVAGRRMDPAVPVFRADESVGEVVEQLRGHGMKTARSLFVVDDAHRLIGKVALTDVAYSSPDVDMRTILQPVIASVRATDPVSEVNSAFEKGNILDIPVIDIDGIFLGAITHENIAESIQSEASVDLQTMVGASKDERALSSPFFTVRKRMPWLQINLVTAFMAAAVVGVFESTIAEVTALAVLLPVVAGQSGNTGAQALAVTMRGLALREITVRQWARVMRKEVIAGLLNGVAIAVTCGLGVYVWSQSFGLVAVIMSSMILAMIAAGFAGAVIPVILTRLGQDPATSSSIILTTVTDVAGFFAFLGIATMLLNYL